MNNLSRVGAGLAVAVLALGVGACGAAPAPVPSSPGPMSSPSTGSRGGATDDGYRGGSGGTMGGPAASALLRTGPVAGEGLDSAAVTALQGAVDQGAQPWRLDPQMTALAFVRSRLGWTTPLAWRSAPNAMLVDDGPGGAVSLALAQPARTGPTGIWTVTAGSWVR